MVKSQRNGFSLQFSQSAGCNDFAHHWSSGPVVSQHLYITCTRTWGSQPRRSPAVGGAVTTSIKEVSLPPAKKRTIPFSELFRNDQVYISKQIVRSNHLSFGVALLLGDMCRAAGRADTCRKHGKELARAVGHLSQRRGEHFAHRKDGHVITDNELAGKAQSAYVQRLTAKMREAKLIKNVLPGPKADRQFLKHEYFGHSEDEWETPFVPFQNNTDVWSLPRELVADPTLTAGEKITCAILGAYGRAHEKCFPSQNLIAMHLGCCVDSVKKYLRSLRHKGVIEVRKERHRNTYVFLYRDLYAVRCNRIHTSVQQNNMPAATSDRIQTLSRSPNNSHKSAHDAQTNMSRCKQPSGAQTSFDTLLNTGAQDTNTHAHVRERAERSTDISRTFRQQDRHTPANPPSQFDVVISCFERWTGNRARPSDKVAAEQLLGSFEVEAIKCGIMLSFYRCRAKIHSLNYCVPVVEEVSSSPISHIRNYCFHLEDRLSKLTFRK
jgi:hypothetical protein